MEECYIFKFNNDQYWSCEIIQVLVLCEIYILLVVWRLQMNEGFGKIETVVLMSSLLLSVNVLVLQLFD